MKKYIITSVLGIFALLILTLFSYFIYDNNWQAAVIDESLTQSEYYTLEEYLEILDEYKTIIIEQNPEVALLQIEARANIDNKFANACHGLVHDIGHEAYEKYQDFGLAMQYANTACNVGYIHGIAESHFENIEDIKTEVESICSAYPSNKTTGWECRHGIGHGLMWSTSNEVQDSLSYCDLFTDSDSLHACYTGVFMENFNTNEIYHPSEFLDTENPFKLCEELPDRYTSDCNHYAVHYYIRANDNDFKKALAKCADIKYLSRKDCSSGVGDLAIKENINNPKEVERLCMTGESKTIVNGCIEGMTGLYVNQFGSIEKGFDLCEILEASNQSTCLAQVRSLPEGYYETN